MKHTNRGKTLLIVLIALIASILAVGVCGMCSLCYLAFGPLPTRVEQTSFVPVEQGFSTDYYDLVLLDSYWQTWDAPKVSFIPLGVEIVKYEDMHLEMEITNKLSQSLGLVCYTENAEGNRFAALAGDLSIPVFSPRETRRGDMVFSVPDEGQELWFYCDLCDDEEGCVMGRNQVGGIQIR